MTDKDREQRALELATDALHRTFDYDDRLRNVTAAILQAMDEERERALGGGLTLSLEETNNLWMACDRYVSDVTPNARVALTKTLYQVHQAARERSLNNTTA